MKTQEPLQIMSLFKDTLMETINVNPLFHIISRQEQLNKYGENQNAM